MKLIITLPEPDPRLIGYEKLIFHSARMGKDVEDARDRIMQYKQWNSKGVVPANSNKRLVGGFPDGPKKITVHKNDLIWLLVQGRGQVVMEK